MNLESKKVYLRPGFSEKKRHQIAEKAKKDFEDKGWTISEHFDGGLLRSSYLILQRETSKPTPTTKTIHSAKLETDPKVKKYVMREGKSVKTDEAFEAWSRNDLPRMMKAMSLKTNLIDRHFLLQSIVQETYKHRNDPKFRRLCTDTAETHISKFPKIAPRLKKEMDGILPRVSTFQKYATLLMEDNEFEKAINICEIAIKFGLRDGTKSGFEGRITRIKKKMTS